MVHVDEVDEFVEDDVLNGFGVGHHEAPGEAEGLFGGATAPACGGIGDANGSGVEAEVVGDTADDRCQVLLGDESVEGDAVFDALAGRGVGGDAECGAVKRELVVGLREEWVFLTKESDFIAEIESEVLASLGLAL